MANGKPARNQDFKYVVTIELHRLSFRDLLAWLHENGHVLRTTMKFGDNSHTDAKPDQIIQDVRFKKRKDAQLFSLAWNCL